MHDGSIPCTTPCMPCTPRVPLSLDQAKAGELPRTMTDTEWKALAQASRDYVRAVDRARLGLPPSSA